VILCLALSPALDLTYRVDRLEPGRTNRVRDVVGRPGGKAVNVARVLHALGEPVQLLAPVGGAVGAEFTAELRRLGVPAELLASGPGTRRTVTVVAAGGEPTVFTEPARIDCWEHFVDRAAATIEEADVVVISGTAPSGAPADAIGELTRLAVRAQRPAVVDTSGPALRSALAAGPTVVKPNRDELAELTGEAHPVAAACDVAAGYGTTVVASLGADGIVAASAGQAWRACPARVLAGNPTGAGDALVAGLARGLRTGAALAEILPDAVALSAAAVLAPYAGELDLGKYHRQRDGVVLESVEPVR
jgi:tagatose 6-phosphate kinase